MKTIEIQINKAHIYDEVSKTTAYIGSKSISEETPNAYQHIFATDANRELLERYYTEAYSFLCDTLRPWLVSSGTTPISRTATLLEQTITIEVSDRTDTDELHNLSFNYIVNIICANWLHTCNLVDKSNDYREMASKHLSTLLVTLYHRKEPTPPTYPSSQPSEQTKPNKPIDNEAEPV